jgi:glutathione S-transferase
MGLKVIGLAGSTCTSFVLATLFEKNVDDFVLQPVDYAGGDLQKPPHLKLQPFGKIPVLQDGDFTLFESRAIARYIAEKYEGGTELLGKTLKEKARVNQWCDVEAHNYNPVVSSIIFQVVYAPLKGMSTDEKVVEEQMAKLEKVLDVYEAHLANNKYLAGDFFSLADLQHVPYTHFLINYAKKGQGLSRRKHVKAWWDNISSRSSWNKVLALQSKE